MTPKPDFSKVLRNVKALLTEYALSPPIPLAAIIEREGLTVMYASLADFHTSDNKEVCALLSVKNKVIIIEETDNPQRQRFSIAHELGHWRLHRAEIEKNPLLGLVPRAPMGKEIEPIEIEANYFAAHLLVPSNLLKEWFEKTQNQHQLAEIFAVSSEFMGWRLINEGLKQ